MSDPQNAGDERKEARSPSTWLGLTLISAGSAAAIGAVVAYWADASTQVFGGLMALALFCGGAGLVAWAHSAMPDETAIGEREELASSPEDRAQFVEAFVSGEQSIARRRLLGSTLVLLMGAISAVGVSLIRSLGPNPFPLLRHSGWQAGTRLVKDDGTPVKPEDVRVGGVLTVFPEGDLTESNSQTLLIHVEPSQLALPSAQQQWSYQGIVAYSKICTHAGCLIGLYQQKQELLLCPCHQSTFDVLRGAQPVAGPATRALPQLPITVDKDGYLVAQSGYKTPVGPGYWNI